jgi:hypothetical protein
LSFNDAVCPSNDSNHVDGRIRFPCPINWAVFLPAHPVPATDSPGMVTIVSWPTSLGYV